MSQFTTPFKGELVGKNIWKTLESFEYHVGTYPSDEVIEVNVGFETDFASIPRIFWPFISPIDRHGKAAVIHDFCYRYTLFTRKKSDKIYREALQVLGTNKIKIFFMYYSVRIFGGFSWRQARKKQKNGWDMNKSW